MRTVLMSVKPKWVEKIASGEKRWEFRRSRVGFPEGTSVLVYRSGKSGAVVGRFSAGHILRSRDPATLLFSLGWYNVTSRADPAVEQYLDGARSVSAIEVIHYRPIEPVTLVELRRRIPGFRPPQSYQFWDGDTTPLLASEWEAPNG